MSPPRNDRGSVTLLFVILAAVFISMAFMVLEGGQKLANLSRAQDLAAEAARIGAATVEVSALADGRFVIDEPQARVQISAVLSAVADPRVSWDPHFVDSQTVEVRVKISQASWIPGFDLEGNGVHRASVIDVAPAQTLAVP